MRPVIVSAMVALLALAARPARAVDVRWGVLGGYNHGLGARGEVVALRFSRTVPLGVALGFGYTRLDPGDAAAARRVFINDATDGTPEKSGYFLDFRLDVIWYLHVARLQHAGVYAGIRRDMFRGRFRFVGGNEDFTIEANDWGFGAGARGEIRLGRSVNLVGAFGIDLYPRSTLYGHDTNYSSDGSAENPRAGYDWKDADKAVNQPRLVPSLMVGIAW
jgi:hypothetical protein